MPSRATSQDKKWPLIGTAPVASTITAKSWNCFQLTSTPATSRKWCGEVRASSASVRRDRAPERSSSSRITRRPATCPARFRVTCCRRYCTSSASRRRVTSFRPKERKVARRTRQIVVHDDRKTKCARFVSRKKKKRRK